MNEAEPAPPMNEAEPAQPMKEAEPAQLLALALELAARAAARHRAGNEGGFDTKSSPTDPVTQVDRDSEALIVDGILAVRPDDSIVGEEGANVDGTSGVQWVIDPLDGTVNFIYGFPEYAVSIGVIDRGVPVAAVVHNSATGTVVWAHRGGGAFWATPDADGGLVEPTRLTMTDGASDERVLLATGFGYDPVVRARQLAVLAEVLDHVRDIRRAGSAALDLCHVAAGHVDAYYETGPNVWDVAAGMLIVTEAGGVATYDPTTKRVLAAGRNVYESLNVVIASAEVSAGMPTMAPENES